MRTMPPRGNRGKKNERLPRKKVFLFAMACWAMTPMRCGADVGWPIEAPGNARFEGAPAEKALWEAMSDDLKRRD